MTTPQADLLHATLALITDALETHTLQPLHTELARSVLTAAGPPSQMGVQAMVDRAAELAVLADALDA